jgi:hypothetical protein
VPATETVPAADEVIVKVFAEASPDQLRVAGVKVTPETGAGVKVPVVVPLGVTVKSPEATPTTPEDGPVRVNAVAATAAAV